MNSKRDIIISKKSIIGGYIYIIKLLGFRTTKAGSPVQSFSVTS